jgi:hypothetical protein
MQVARDIEDPFLYDPNELPLPQMQYRLNERLIAVSHSRRPVAFTDVGDLTGPGNTVMLRDSPLGRVRADVSHSLCKFSFFVIFPKNVCAFF